MKSLVANVLGLALKSFFSDYLPKLRGMSPHTILSYRDSIKLLLLFLANQKGIFAADLLIKDIGVPQVIAFLESLENNRHNGIGTRNVRLSALHAFFRYLPGIYPEYLDQSQRILAIPFKRMTNRTVEYLEFEEITAVLQMINHSTRDGRRDHVLLTLMFNTGARVQEIVDLKASDLQLSKPYSVLLYGKGRKERICPIWPETANMIRDYMEERGIDMRKPVTIFTNHTGTPLTRFGVRYILAKYIKDASSSLPSLKNKRLHPHSMRHSTAIYLLKSGVDPSTIANWLGHVSINTTNKYITMDLEMKRQALEKAKPLPSRTNPGIPWKQDPDILAWLESI